ncbi:hypothetical protein [Corynebacterium marquesiae]|uniref:hypothetical protein n=1 Tax=Corynebacterium marquesiae TaxID=2913503 RepID=UPI0038D22815
MHSSTAISESPGYVSTYLEIEGFGLGPIADEEIVELVETVAAARDKKEGFIAEWFAERLI